MFLLEPRSLRNISRLTKLLNPFFFFVKIKLKLIKDTVLLFIKSIRIHQLGFSKIRSRMFSCMQITIK